MFPSKAYAKLSEFELSLQYLSTEKWNPHKHLYNGLALLIVAPHNVSAGKTSLPGFFLP